MATTATTGIIEVSRPHYVRHKFGSLRIDLDGKQVAKIRDATSVQLPVAAGPHKIRVRMPWGSSPATTLTVNPGETVKRKVEIVGSPLRMFYAWGKYFRLVTVGTD